MADFSDKEQLDALRAWWDEHGNYVIGGVLAGVIIIFGWNWRQSSVAEKEIAASVHYEEVMSAAGLALVDVASEPANILFEEYPESPYADHARLAMAKLYMDRSRDQDAADMLQALLDSAPEKELTMIARQRLAKVFLYQNKPEEVLALLKDLPDSAFSARYSELIGDAYAAMGSYTEAEAAYIAALNDNQLAPTVETNLVQLKMNDLPVPGEVDPAVDATGLSPDSDASEGEAGEAGTSPAQEDAAAEGIVDENAATNAAEDATENSETGVE